MSGSRTAPAITDRAEESQRKEPHERGPAPQVLPVLPVEGAGVALGVLGCGVELRSGGAAAALTLPPHGRALAREAKAVAEQPAAQRHRYGHYAAAAEGPAR